MRHRVKSVELGHGDRALAFFAAFSAAFSSRPAVERISTFAGFDLGEFRDDLEAFSRGEAATALRCASRPRPERPCFWLQTR